ncbi:MAG: dipeptidase [Pyramidobacter sp.]|jgi:dipeptidase
MLNFFVAAVVLAAILFAAGCARACTSMGAGRLASADGSVLITHSCDGWYDARLRVIEGGEHAPGEMLPIYNVMCHANHPAEPLKKVGEIPQAPRTYKYFQIAYPFMNEFQVMIGEFTWTGRPELASPQGLFYIENLEAIALARCTNARDTVIMMGQMAEKYGYADGGETLIVGDPREAWVFEVIGGGKDWHKDSGLPGAYWAAKRIPDDEFFVGANRSRLGVIDFDDGDTLTGTGLREFAEKMGVWKPGEAYNYSKIFNPEPYGYAFYASRREWRVLNLIAPSKNFPVKTCHEAYPFSVKPDKKLTVQDLMAVYSDHLEGTEYDLTKGLAAGPFGCPVRYFTPAETRPDDRKHDDWERSIAIYRCAYSFVAQCRDWLPNAIGGILWFGQGSPDTTVYAPIYCGTTEVPRQWSDYKSHVFDRHSAWWPFVLVNNWAQLRWNAMYPDIRARREDFMNRFFAEQQGFENRVAQLCADGNELEAQKVVTEHTCATLDALCDGWWDFAFELIGKYHDGAVMTAEGAMTTPGYPKEWLKQVHFGDSAEADLKKLGHRQVSGSFSGISL